MKAKARVVESQIRRNPVLPWHGATFPSVPGAQSNSGALNTADPSKQHTHAAEVVFRRCDQDMVGVPNALPIRNSFHDGFNISVQYPPSFDSGRPPLG